MTTRDIPEPPADFGVDLETLAFIVLKAKQFDALVGTDDPSDASDSIDDRFVDALEDEADNPVERELAIAIDSLDADAQMTLVALTWLGRGDYDAEDWREALTTARERAQGSTARYLLGIPLLGDYLEVGADKLGVSLTSEEAQGLIDPDIDTRGS
jgi:hypothetical protein